MSDERPDQTPQERDTPQQQLVEMGSSVVKNRHGTIHCLTIIGQIEGHTLAPNNAKTTKYGSGRWHEPWRGRLQNRP